MAIRGRAASTAPTLERRPGVAHVALKRHPCATRSGRVCHGLEIIFPDDSGLLVALRPCLLVHRFLLVHSLSPPHQEQKHRVSCDQMHARAVNVCRYGFSVNSTVEYTVGWLSSRISTFHLPGSLWAQVPAVGSSPHTSMPAPGRLVADCTTTGWLTSLM